MCADKTWEKKPKDPKSNNLVLLNMELQPEGEPTRKAKETVLMVASCQGAGNKRPVFTLWTKIRANLCATLYNDCWLVSALLSSLGTRLREKPQTSLPWGDATITLLFTCYFLLQFSIFFLLIFCYNLSNCIVCYYHLLSQRLRWRKKIVIFFLLLLLS